MGKATGIMNYRQRVKKLKEQNLTSDLLSSVVFEDPAAVQDVLRILTGICDLKVLRVEPVRMIKGTDRQAENGVHEIYANLEYPAEDEEVTRLLQFIGDTNNPKISRDGLQNLSERVEYLTNETGGARDMCELMEREWNNGRKEGELFHLIDQVVKKRDRKITVEGIADVLEEEEVMIERILLAAAEAGSNEVEEIYACL